MSWLRIDTASLAQPPLLALARLMGDDLRARGLWVTVLLWVGQHVPDGDLGDYAPGDLARAWGVGDAEIGALVTSGVLVATGTRPGRDRDATDNGVVATVRGVRGWDEIADGWREAQRSRARRAARRDGVKASDSAPDQDATRTRPGSDQARGEERRGKDKRGEGEETESSTSPERSALTLDPAPGRAPRARRPRASPEGPHEADPSDTETEVVAEVPSTQGPVRVRRALVEALRSTAPGVDVDLEVRRAAEWSAGNPTRRKTASGVRRFLASWMARQQDRGVGGGPGMGQAPRGPYRGSQRPQTQGERIAELEAREAAGTMGPGEAGELTRWRLRNLGGLELVAGGAR